jgi:hypothetical protein
MPLGKLGPVLDSTLTKCKYFEQNEAKRMYGVGVVLKVSQNTDFSG